MSDGQASTVDAEQILSEALRALDEVRSQAMALEDLSRRLAQDVQAIERQLAGVVDEKPSAAPSTEPSALAPAEPSVAAPAEPSAATSVAPQEALFEPPQRSTDVEGARLVALNMVLNGDSREATSRYLGEHFDVPDRDGLLDEVCAAAGIAVGS